MFYIRTNLFPTNCTSVGRHIYYDFFHMFRLIIIAIFRYSVDTKEYLMLKYIVIYCTWWMLFYKIQSLIQQHAIFLWAAIYIYFHMNIYKQIVLFNFSWIIDPLWHKWCTLNQRILCVFLCVLDTLSMSMDELISPC